MRNKFKPVYILVILFSLFSFKICEAAQESPVAVAYQVKRINNFLSEPGNNPYEILRRMGREINKNLPSNAKTFYGASLLNLDQINNKKFLKPTYESHLSPEKLAKAKDIIANFENEFNSISTFNEEEGAILFKLAFNSQDLLNSINQEKKRLGKSLKENQGEQIDKHIMPYLENSDYFIAIVSISNKGIQLDGQLVSQDKKLSFEANGITISKYFNKDALITLVQNQGKLDPDFIYDELAKNPQVSFINSALAAVEIDLKKDVLGNLPSETILSVNLAPTGQGGLPDLRFVSQLPDKKAIESLYPKLRELCMQNGLLNVYFEKPYKFVKTSFTMFPQFSLYFGILDEFLIITTGEENYRKEAKRIEEAKKITVPQNNEMNKYDRYFRIGFERFNEELQRLLQSPLFQNIGIPPIPNLKFLDDMIELVGHFELSSSGVLLKINLPLKPLKK